jgi:hypothetical protein
MGYEFDDELEDLEEIEDNTELFHDGIEQISDGMLCETKELDNGVVSERIMGSESHEAEEMPEVIGEPKEDMEHWHLQSEDMSCAVACQEFVADELLNEDISEKKMIEYAEQQGWYEKGTNPEDVGKLLESMGLDVERQFNGKLEDIEQTLESGGKVMVSVNNHTLKDPNLSEIAGLGANHVVEVIGIDRRDPNNVKVILNDPGVENGRGIEHSVSDFEKAWETGGCYMVSAYKDSSAGDEKKEGLA